MLGLRLVIILPLCINHPSSSQRCCARSYIGNRLRSRHKLLTPVVPLSLQYIPHLRLLTLSRMYILA